MLPAASFPESDDIVASYFHYCLGAQVKATEPLGESLPNSEIFRRLAAAMGYEEQLLYESDAEVIANVLAPTGVSFDELAARGRRIGDAELAMHPADAADRGLRAGERALVQNGVGQLRLTVAVSDELPRGVVYSPKGRWPKREATGANINVLNPGQRSDMGRSTAVHGVEVSVSRL